jgi:fatty acid synthase
VPDVDQGVALLRELAGLGMHHNALKPGTVAQVDQVIAIARAVPELTLIVHLEGGRAGGHHSWEDLDDLLLATYARMRACPNLVLAVGGGVAEEGRAADLLTGRWALAHGELPMPVDAVFVGTVAMATAESTASPSVKAALVAAKGSEDWAYAGESVGGVTSGRSGLDADIHYLDNAAARCGRLLDAVAGDADAVAARRDEIVAALNATAKPYFGDVAEMTYGALLDRLLALTAVGRHGPYEDGPWPDVSYRARFAEAVRRAEARCRPGETGEVASVVAELSALDTPADVLVALRAAVPQVDTLRLHPADEDWFVRKLCRMRGKPVNFVPVIDADVRRWYASDSLWQAQDDRFEADQVLVLPGPAAVAGIRRVDEPVAELLARFEAAVVDQLLDVGGTARPRESRRVRSTVALPEAVRLRAHDHRVRLDASGPVPPAVWCDHVASTLEGPIAALFGAAQVRCGDRAIANPVRAVAVASPETYLEVAKAGGRVESAIWRDTTTGDALRVRTRGDEVRVDLHLGGGSRLTLRFTAELRASGWSLSLSPDDLEAALRSFYGEVLGLTETVVAPMSRTTRTASLGEDRARAYAAVTGGAGGRTDLAFSAAWPAILDAVATEGAGRDLLRLVHLQHTVSLKGDPARLHGALAVEAHATALRSQGNGRVLEVHAELSDDAGLVATVVEQFYVRGRTEPVSTWQRHVTQRLAVDAGARAFLAALPWMTLDTDADVLDVDAVLSFERGGRVTADGVVRQGGDVVGTLSLDEAAGAEHPVVAALALFATPGATPVQRRTLVDTSLPTPRELQTFAEVSGDANPIHTSPAYARLAGLSQPIVHGMWSSAALQGVVVRALAGGDVARLQDWSASFVDVVLPSETLRVQVHRSTVADGVLGLEVVGSVVREGAQVVVVRATAALAPPRTAVVFPGQGIQQQGMGQEAYGRSRRAREIWDRADAHTRTLGFSILRIVRDNPRTVRVGRQLFRHPEGVLHLTRFTQVAMAVLATAQVAELRDAGLLGTDVVFAGHSIGEYNALCALAEVLPLEAVVDIVYERGATMESLVPRDAEGQSPYAMAAVRPFAAKLDEAGLLALVAAVSAEHGFLQVVNHNVRDVQYAIAGERPALVALEAAIEARVPPGGRAAWVLVPGIDVPFHSARLAAGVPGFRETLRSRLPASLPWQGLVGRYVPNLVARPFELTPSFVTAIAEATGAPEHRELLERCTEMDDDTLARVVLVELLAWQFASPVRWIETQDRFFASERAGGLGVAQLLEVGVGHAPTVRNMARHTLRGMRIPETRIALLNTEADAERVFLRDADPVVEEVVVDVPEETEAAPAPTAVVARPVAVVEDRTLGVAEALFALLALQSHTRPEQIRPDETIDDLFDGVSSKRNQVLLDLGEVFGGGAIDGAHERPLHDLVAQLEPRCRSYRAPGPLLSAAATEATKRCLGGLSRADVERRLTGHWSLGAGLTAMALVELALQGREGDSVRGGPLGSVAPAGDKSGGTAALDGVVTALGERLGVAFAVPTTAAASADPQAVSDLRDDLLGWDGALMRPMRTLAASLGFDVERETGGLPQVDAAAARLEALEAEVGTSCADRLAPAFDAAKHVVFDDAWSLARRDLVALVHGADGLDDDAIRAEAARLARFSDDTPMRDTASWFLRTADGVLAEALQQVLDGRVGVAWSGAAAFQEALWASDTAPALRPVEAFREVLQTGAETPWDFRGRTALVTGASPGSIAAAVVAHLLAGGARVVVTTSRLTRARRLAYRELYRRFGGPDAELHVVPFNQASRQDATALVDWLFSRVTEQAGATVRVLKEPFAPDLLIPFAASGDVATLDQVGPDQEIALRTLLLGVERLVTGVARRYLEEGQLDTPCQVLLPMSPNHGTFGGDGLYGECKAALGALVNRWHPERAAWGEAVAMVPVTIGWVRGTGLMGGNDVVADAVTAHTGARTFSTDEMGWLLAGLCTDAMHGEALDAPLWVDVSGGLGDGIGAIVGDARAALTAEATGRRRHEALSSAYAEALGERPAPTVPLLPTPPEVAETEAAWPDVAVDLKRVVVLVGSGEIGPCGTSRTRRALEVGDLTAGAVLELAWITGLVRYDAHLDGGAWVDAETGEAVPEHALVARYADAVRARSGVRFLDPATVGYDPDDRPVLESVRLDEDFRFRVETAEEAASFLRADPEHTRVGQHDGAWWVTRTAGATLRLPRSVRLTRQVGAPLPDGFDLARWGIGPELQASVDRLSLLNLVATVEAFASAGLTPEELLRHVHPALVGNTQGSGIGGMGSIRRMYTDQLLGNGRQADILQESLGNVVAAWVVQSYVGSYGPMTHPVAACATAAVSVESGVDKILAGKACFVVAGGFDDLGPEGQLGFADMHATAETEAMLSMGFEAHEMSRANDRRRRGFVEAQGGGTLLLARGDVALQLGLPVQAVVAYAASFSDGVHTSIPAPGQGLLAAARGGDHSPLARALDTWGLTADDIAVVYKHDTSTSANDPNEARLHHRIQTALGRTPGNPLLVSSQKTLTGHSKGGAAAWQLIGLAQSLVDGVVPGNRNLACLDPELRACTHLVHSDTDLRPSHAMRAGLVSSLGFGHVNALVMLVHPDAFVAALDPAQRAAWRAASDARRERAARTTHEVWMGRRPAFVKRTDRPDADGEGAMLLGEA